ncbi:MAG: CDP-glycerol glycerophosphotransferase family protein [Defluviitaleaceae bacterium]|nr:CDP-glycerol glycerophosphotransferase family protein [Defluviitaleaceae bacterium]
MRKHHQKEILSLIQTIEDAQINGLYAVCQEGAEAIIDFIESLDIEGLQTITLLEQYFQLLFKANQGEIKIKILRDHLIKIKNNVIRELKPTRLEVVFISHKASMSDSIESIYLAAKEDPDCDAYWIPVPYYEHNTEGKPETLRFEGADCYPNIECVDWEQYDITTRCPDVIFTFSAYDANNKVSSIHPDFYCQRLREFTDMLCYVQYFLWNDEPLEHFCKTPACMYAHKVILPSEKTRNYYMRVFNSVYGTRFGKHEDRFIALGSPKLDKVFSTKKENCNLPFDWETRINNKKVILYASSISPALQTNVRYIHKLKLMIEYFNNRNDVVLWWRPHPLLENTFVSVMPTIASYYKQIVEDFCRQKRGIYDDTPDLHRAITMGDGYYGDWGSLMFLYQATGKPAMMADTIIDESMKNVDLGNCLREDKGNVLNDFVDGIVNGSNDDIQLKSFNKNELVGQKIYKYIKKNLGFTG